MSKIRDKTISATEARKNWFELLNSVYFTGESVIIEKNKLPLVKLIPAARPKTATAKEVIEKTYGMLKDAKKSDWPNGNKKASREKWDYLESLWKK